MRRRILRAGPTVLFVAFSALSTVRAVAGDEYEGSRSDVISGAGMTSGKLSQVDGQILHSASYLGPVLTFGVQQGLSKRWAAVGEAEVALDAAQRQTLRKGAGFYMNYNIFGGSRRVVQSINQAEITARSSRDLSLGSGVLVADYAAINRDDQSEHIAGMTMEGQVRVALRQDIGDRFAVGFEVRGSVVSLPLGHEQIKTSNLSTVLTLIVEPTVFK